MSLVFPSFPSVRGILWIAARSHQKFVLETWLKKGPPFWNFAVSLVNKYWTKSLGSPLHIVKPKSTVLTVNSNHLAQVMTEVSFRFFPILVFLMETKDDPQTAQNGPVLFGTQWEPYPTSEMGKPRKGWRKQWSSVWDWNFQATWVGLKWQNMEKRGVWL